MNHHVLYVSGAPRICDDLGTVVRGPTRARQPGEVL